jgi:hypothetical protein
MGADPMENRATGHLFMTRQQRLSDRLEALRNLSFLIRSEIDHPKRVSDYLVLLESVLLKMREENS